MVSEQRDDDKTAYWRTLKAVGELNQKYLCDIEAQKEKLEEKVTSLSSVEDDIFSDMEKSRDTVTTIDMIPFS